MARLRSWAIGVAVVGTTASVLAAALFWFLVTHPVGVAVALARGL